MRTNENGKSRSDRPSGRQAMDHLGHAKKATGPAVPSLHQGQGPDFLTQDDAVRQENDGVKQIVAPGKQHQQRFDDGADPREEPELGKTAGKKRKRS